MALVRRGMEETAGGEGHERGREGEGKNRRIRRDKRETIMTMSMWA